MLFFKYHLNVWRLGNLKMSIVYCSALDINNNICDNVPLDTSSNIVQISKYCLT